jgi:hypothetical protein
MNTRINAIVTMTRTARSLGGTVRVIGRRVRAVAPNGYAWERSQRRTMVIPVGDDIEWACTAMTQAMLLGID